MGPVLTTGYGIAINGYNSSELICRWEGSGGTPCDSWLLARVVPPTAGDQALTVITKSHIIHYFILTSIYPEAVVRSCLGWSDSQLFTVEGRCGLVVTYQYNPLLR